MEQTHLPGQHMCNQSVAAFSECLASGELRLKQSECFVKDTDFMYGNTTDPRGEVGFRTQSVSFTLRGQMLLDCTV